MSNVINFDEKHAKELEFLDRFKELLKQTDLPYWSTLGLVQATMHEFTDIALGPMIEEDEK